ncbi:MAG: hypothetical protein ACOC58_05470 [Chloroflexota bacterium]
MRQLANEKRARLTALERELVQRVSQSRFFDQRTCSYTAPRAKMPTRVKWLIEVDGS